MDNTKLIEAVGKLVKAKGRFHTEQNYKAVVEAYDEALAERAASNPASPAKARVSFDNFWTMKAIEYKGRPFTSRREAAQEAWSASLSEAGIPASPAKDCGACGDGCPGRACRVEAESPPASPAPVAAITDEEATFDKWASIEYRNASHYTALEHGYGRDAWMARAALSSAPMAQAEPKPLRTPEQLLAVARDTGLRSFLHGVNATDARELLSVYIDAVRQLDTNYLPATPAVPAAPSERDAGKCKTCGGEGWVRDQHDMEQGLLRCTRCPAAPAAPIERENGQ